MIFTKWQDFVIYPMNARKVKSRRDRLDTSKAYFPMDSGLYPNELHASIENGAAIQIESVLRDGDEFEAMEVDDFGDVTIWTRDRVWYIGLSLRKIRYYLKTLTN